MSVDTEAIKGGLTRKIGPLPTYGWAAVIVGGIVVWRVLNGRPAFGGGGSSDSVGVSGAGQPSGFPTADETPSAGTVGFDPSQGTVQNPTEATPSPTTVGSISDGLSGLASGFVTALRPVSAAVRPVSAAVGAPTMTTAPLAKSPTVPSPVLISPALGIGAEETAYLNRAATVVTSKTAGAIAAVPATVPYVSHQNDPAALAAARAQIKVTPSVTRAIAQVKKTMPRKAPTYAGGSVRASSAQKAL